MGPVSHAMDHGGAAMSALASLVDADDPDEIDAILDSIPDVAGTFYRYGLPHSQLYARCGVTPGNGGS
jgi:F420-non-reducing hydrogenase small subunit